MSGDTEIRQLNQNYLLVARQVGKIKAAYTLFAKIVSKEKGQRKRNGTAAEIHKQKILYYFTQQGTALHRRIDLESQYFLFFEKSRYRVFLDKNIVSLDLDVSGRFLT